MENDKQLPKPKRSSNNKLFKFLPKAASAVSFQNPPFSPGRDNKKRSSETATRARFSGPLMVSIIPKEARTRRSYGGRHNPETPGVGEPTSPKVSCMGQIKHHRKKKESAAKKPPTVPEKKGLRRFFSGGKRGMGKKSDFDAVLTREGDVASKLPERAPGLGQMRRFASSRDAFANFDWSAQIAPVEPNYQSDEEGREQSDYDDEVRIPFSAPMAIGGGDGGGYSEREANLQPKKEINLWKRRTMARPLQLETLMN